MHLDEPVFDALLRGDLDATTGRPSWEHLNGCGTCRLRFDEFVAADQEVAKRLRLLDDTPPAVAVGAVIGRARMLVERGRRRRRVAAWAAGLGTMMGAALAAALPSSPLGRYVRVTLGRTGAAGAPARTAASALQQAPSGGEIAVGAAGDVQVRFLAPQAAGEIRIAFNGEPVIRVSPVGARTPESSWRYTVAPGTVTVDNVGSDASYQVTFPTAAPRARVVVGAHTVFTMDEHHVATTAAPDGSGQYVFPFSTSSSPR